MKNQLNANVVSIENRKLKDIVTFNHFLINAYSIAEKLSNSITMKLRIILGQRELNNETKEAIKSLKDNQEYINNLENNSHIKSNAKELKKIKKHYKKWINEIVRKFDELEGVNPDDLSQKDAEALDLFMIQRKTFQQALISGNALKINMALARYYRDEVETQEVEIANEIINEKRIGRRLRYVRKYIRELERKGNMSIASIPQFKKTKVNFKKVASFKNILTTKLDEQLVNIFGANSNQLPSEVELRSLLAHIVYTALMLGYKKQTYNTESIIGYIGQNQYAIEEVIKSKLKPIGKWEDGHTAEFGITNQTQEIDLSNSTIKRKSEDKA